MASAARTAFVRGTPPGRIKEKQATSFKAEGLQSGVFQTVDRAVPISVDAKAMIHYAHNGKNLIAVIALRWVVLAAAPPAATADLDGDDPECSVLRIEPASRIMGAWARANNSRHTQSGSV